MKTKTHKKFISISLLIICAALVTIALYNESKGYIPVFGHLECIYETVETFSFDLDENPKNEIIFSHNEHFYLDNVKLTLTTENEDITEIYYTLDARPPNSERGILYTDEIILVSGYEQINPYTIKVCGKKSDGTFTEIQTHSYFLGADILRRFDTLIFSLSTDPEHLFDFDHGIAVSGKLRRDYIAQTGDRNPEPPAPANYNMRGRDAERPVYIEVFDRSGQLLISQNAGIRIFGGWSRAMPQKSFKLFARHEYEPGKGTFDYDFFPDNTTYYRRPITDYDRLILRNNANDNPFAFLRNEMSIGLAAGILTDTQSYRPAAVFLNGMYYGFAWLHQVFDDGYFDDHNEMKGGEWVILSGTEGEKEVDDDNPLKAAAALDYQMMYDFHYLDLTDNEIFAELCELMDIDNFLAYYAVQIYINNYDWPHNNYKVYRYYGTPESYNNDGISTADGKWRWLLFDTDFSFGLYGSSPGELTLGRLLGFVPGDVPYSPLLISILERDDMRDRFITMLCDLMNYHYSPENVEQMVRKLEVSRLNELTHNFRLGGPQLTGSWSNLNHVSHQLDQIIDFGRQRPDEMKKQISRYLEIESSGYFINLKAHELTGIKLNTIDISNDFSGFYFDFCSVKVSAGRPVGYKFSHWVLNDRVVTDEILIISEADAVNGEVNLRLYFEEAWGSVPVISLIDYEEGLDYIEIFNPYNNEVDLRNLYISDNPAMPYRQIMPSLSLEPGQRMILYCDNYVGMDAFGAYRLDFSLKNGETLVMTDRQGERVFELCLPKIDNDYVLVKDMRSGEYVGRKR